MTITTRHIRHNWPEWVDWTEQKTVKSACGVRTTPKLSGIPGVTEQPLVVYDAAGVARWGWCARCVRHTWPYLSPPGLTLEVAPQAILDLHEQARKILAPMRYRMVKDSYLRASAPAKVLLHEELANMQIEFSREELTIPGGGPVTN